MAKKASGRAKPREPATLETPRGPWGSAPYENSQVTRAAPVDEEEEATGVLVFPPEAGGDGGRTLFSTKAVLLAHLLREKFLRRSFGKAPPRFLRIEEPEGPSTAGGRLARQPLSLVTRGKAVAPSIPCGWVDTSKGEAQLRGYELVKARYEAHQGTPLTLSREQYEAFLDDLVEVLMAGSIKVRVFIPEPGSAPAPVKPPPRGRFGQVVALVLVFALGLLAGRMLRGDALDAMTGPRGAQVK